MKPILAICRQEKIGMKKSLYGIGFVMIFSIVTNLQIFWFYGIQTDINMDLNCDKTFYLWSVLIPAMIIRFLVPMILLTVTNFLTIRKVITSLRKIDLNQCWWECQSSNDFDVTFFSWLFSEGWNLEKKSYNDISFICRLGN